MGILETDVVVMDQIRSFMSNDFGIYDAQGQGIGTIRTEGGMGSRMLMGNRELAVVDGNGSLLFRVTDPPNFGLDTFEITDEQGQALGRVVKEFTFFSKSLRVELAGGTVLNVSGSLFDHEFTVDGPGGRAATVSRQWPGVAQLLLSRERYVLVWDQGVPRHERVGILGSVLALDLVRAKERNNG